MVKKHVAPPHTHTIGSVSVAVTGKNIIFISI